jgi:plasmid stabilization system protein ParE
MKVVYSSRALAQLASVYDYLSERSPKAAENVAVSIRETVARLEYLPQLGRRTDEGDVHVVIEPEYLYRVFYRIHDDQVLVLRILHRSQTT